MSSVKVLKAYPAHYSDKYRDSGEYWLLCRADTRPALTPMLAALTYSCHCEHDCCGHMQSYVRQVQHVKRKEWRILVSFYRNI